MTWDILETINFNNTNAHLNLKKIKWSKNIYYQQKWLFSSHISIDSFLFSIIITSKQSGICFPKKDKRKKQNQIQLH